MADVGNTRVADAERRLRRWIEQQLPSPHELATTPLPPVADRPQGRGTTPSAMFADPSGRRILFRAMRPEEIAAEELAQTVRAPTGRTCRSRGAPSSSRRVGSARSGSAGAGGAASTPSGRGSRSPT